MNGCKCNISISLDVVDDNCISQSSSLFGPSVTLDLCANERYSLQSYICKTGEVTSLSVNFSKDVMPHV